MILKTFVQDYVKNIPMKRIGEAEEASNLVAYVASDMASYSTDVEFIANVEIMNT